MSTEYSVLRLVAGSKFIDFLGENFHFVSWAPSVARRRDTMTGGYASYEDTVERIRFNVSGNTAQEIRGLLLEIMAMLEQADGWALGDDVDPVLIETQVQGSTEPHPLRAMVLGRAGQNDSLLNLPMNFHDRLAIFEVEGAEIIFRRSGLWLGEEMKGVSTVGTTPSIMTVNMGEELHSLAPTRLAFKGFGGSTELIGDGFVLLTGVPVHSTFGANFAVYGSGSMASSEFSAVDDSAKLAYDSYVMRIDANSYQTGRITISGVNANVSKLQIFVALRNNSSSTAWEIRALSTGYVTDVTGWVKVGAEKQTPFIRHIGLLANQTGTHTNIELEVKTSESAGTLDIGHLVVFPLDPNARHLILEGRNYSDAAFARNLVIDPRPLTHNVPVVYIETA